MDYETADIMSLLICSICILTVYIFSLALIFQKAKEKAYKALIPIYNIYTLSKISKATSAFHIGLDSSIFLLAIKTIIATEMITNDNVITALTILGYLLLTLILIARIDICYNLGKVFKKKLPFLIGLILFPQLFIFILSIDKSKYIE